MTSNKVTRRNFLGKISGWLIGLGLLAQLSAFIRSLIPNVLYEPSQKSKIGLPSEFSEGVRFFEEKKVFVFKEQNTFHAISAICTHLGCTVKHAPFSKPREVTIKGETKVFKGEFRCPCHGSAFHGDGTNYTGPAPKPLLWHYLEISPDDGQLIVDTSKEVDRDYRLAV